MALTLDTVKNFAEWDRSHWRTFFQTHGDTLAHREIPHEVGECVMSKEFQETMVKVGIFGSKLLFEQIPSVWNVELNNKIPPLATYGEPRHFTSVTLLATRLMLDRTDFDEALLIKQEAAEPFMLVRMGNTWYVNLNATIDGDLSGGFSYSRNETRLVGSWEEFESIAKIYADESMRKTRVVEHLTRYHSFSSSLANLVASYSEQVSDKHAQDKRDLRKVLYVEFNKRPSCHGDWINDTQNAAKMASGIIAGYLDEPENYRKEPEPTQKSVLETLPPLEEPKKTESCWDSFCAYINSWANWFFSLFT